MSRFVAAAGAASRRKAAALIRAGRVRVDGEVVVNPSHRVAPEVAWVEVDGQRLRFGSRIYIVLNKPRGPLSAVEDRRGRPTVVDLLGGMKERLYPAGRLDADTEGLLVMTNDGDLTLRLTHPRYGVEKVYEAEVEGCPSEGSLRQLEEGVMLHDGPAGPARVRILATGRDRSRVELTIHSGRKRQVRRMLQAVGHRVRSLVRTRVGPLTLEGLQPGEWRRLSEQELARLRAYVEQVGTREQGRGREGRHREESREGRKAG